MTIEINEIKRYIDFYNEKCYQSKLKGLTPIEYRDQAFPFYFKFLKV
ncbi:IS3 family transposase [Acholeplasma palmae]